jgi:hypothetical protein
VKELEFLTLKLDKKSEKVTELKKRSTDSESKVVKLTSKLENVKTFLRFLNTSFIKSMKQ